jgi:hypothetical protein
MNPVTFRVAGATVAARAPERVTAVLERMLSRMCGPAGSGPADIEVEARTTARNWTVTVDTDPPKRLNVERNALPAQVAGTMVSATMTALAARDAAPLLRGAVLACDGQALALRGRDWRELFVLSAHLAARGWSIVAGSVTWIDDDARVRPVHKLLYGDAPALARVPRAFRGALEVSPWYVSNREIIYYAADPADAFGPGAWSEGAHLAGTLDLAPRNAAAPSLAGGTGAVGHPHATLTAGAAIATADAIERWWEDAVLIGPAA